MLLDFPKGAINVDGKAAIEDLRVNVAPNHQLRVKFKVIQHDKDPVPLDIVVFNYSVPHLEGASLAINIVGTEMTMNKPFKMNLSFNFIKRKWRLQGTFNAKEVDETITNLIEIIAIAKALV